MNPNNDLFRAYIFTISVVGVLVLVGYVLPRGDDATQGIFRIADGLVTGALGFFAGRATVQSRSSSAEPPQAPNPAQPSTEPVAGPSSPQNPQRIG